jgi:hypothetical protein
MTPALLLALVVMVPKIDVPRLDTSKIHLDLPNMPTANGLVATPKDDALTAQKTDDSAAKEAPAKVVSVQVAHEFAPTAEGMIAVSPVSTFVATTFPTRLFFQTNVRVASAAGHLPAWLKVQVRTPGGLELASTTRAVSFEKDIADAVFKWEALLVQGPGDYLLTVKLDGVVASEVPLRVVGPEKR